MSNGVVHVYTPLYRCAFPNTPKFNQVKGIIIIIPHIHCTYNSVNFSGAKFSLK